MPQVSAELPDHAQRSRTPGTRQRSTRSHWWGLSVKFCFSRRSTSLARNKPSRLLGTPPVEGPIR
eukprot:7692079-Alexandrium_andersonii.AAC.1